MGLQAYTQMTLKELSDEFHALRQIVYIEHNATEQTQSLFDSIKQQLLEQLEEKIEKSREEIARSDRKKNDLIRNLQTPSAQNDKDLQDEIIQELEEYGRMRRYYIWQLSKLTRIIEDINQSPEEYQKTIRSGQPARS